MYPGTQPPSPLGVVPLMSALTDTIPSIKDTHDDNLSTPGEKRVHDVNKFHSAFQQVEMLKSERSETGDEKIKILVAEMKFS